MDIEEQWNRRTTILNGITAALAYIDGQVDDLRSLVAEEVDGQVDEPDERL